MKQTIVNAIAELNNNVDAALDDHVYELVQTSSSWNSASVGYKEVYKSAFRRGYLKAISDLAKHDQLQDLESSK